MAKIQSSVPVMLNEAKYLSVLRSFSLRRVIGGWAFLLLFASVIYRLPVYPRPHR